MARGSSRRRSSQSCGTSRYCKAKGLPRLELRVPYPNVDLAALRALSSEYAVPLFLRDCPMTTARRKVPPLNLAELHALVGEPDGAYPKFAELNCAVLQRALQDIKTVTPL